MNAEIVQTGSSGNCVILDKILCLDMGVSFKKIRPYLGDLQLVFISHIHSDHYNRAALYRMHKQRPSLRFCCNVYVAADLAASGVSMRSIDVLEDGYSYDYGILQIEPFKLYHDVENLGLKIYIGEQKAFYAVDTGHLDGIEAKDFDIYLLEANHYEEDIEDRAREKLAAGEYSYEVRAAQYHLSFEQACDWLVYNMGSNGMWFPLHQHEEKEQCLQESVITG